MHSVQQIPTYISSSSLIGVNSEFPRGHGNYISTYDSKSRTQYQIVNLSYEDLVDAIYKGIIDTTTIEAEVYEDLESKDFNCNQITEKVAFIIDKRFPQQCLIPEWWYGYRSKFKVDILRKKYNVPDGVCLCEFEDSKKSGIFYSHMSYAIDGYVDCTGICCECQKPHRNVRKRT